MAPRRALFFSPERAAPLAAVSSLREGARLALCAHEKISLVSSYVHLPRLIYLLFLQKDNVGSARHQLETP